MIKTTFAFSRLIFSLLLISWTFCSIPTACSKDHETPPTIQKEVLDTFHSANMTVFPNWDFKSTRPIIIHLSFQKYHYDSAFAWDPGLQQFVEWDGEPSGLWNYDRREHGRYRLNILTETLIDTTQPAYDDRGSYLSYNLNQEMLNKPVLQVVDTVDNKPLVTLLLGKIAHFSINLDTSRFIKPIPGRPSSIELAKNLNACFKDLFKNYRFNTIENK